MNDLLGRVKNLQIGELAAEELEQAIEPITERIDELEKKITELITISRRGVELMEKVSPLLTALERVPFLNLKK